MPTTLGPMKRPWIKERFDQDITDLAVTNEGNIFLFRPVSNAGREFVASFAEQEDVQYFGTALVAEHRYAADIAAHAIDEGLHLA
jgi:hypothetical protein